MSEFTEYTSDIAAAVARAEAAGRDHETNEQRAARWSVAHEDLAAIIAGAPNDKRKPELEAQLAHLGQWVKRGEQQADDALYPAIPYVQVGRMLLSVPTGKTNAGRIWWMKFPEMRQLLQEVADTASGRIVWTIGKDAINKLATVIAHFCIGNSDADARAALSEASLVELQAALKAITGLIQSVPANAFDDDAEERHVRRRDRA